MLRRIKYWTKTWLLEKFKFDRRVPSLPSILILIRNGCSKITIQKEIELPVIMVLFAKADYLDIVDLEMTDEVSAQEEF